MMGKYSVIDNNILDKQGILNLLKQFIFGNSDIEIYDQNRIYKYGDKSYIIDTTTGDIRVVTANGNNITGPYDETKWTHITLSDTVSGGSDKVVVISQYRPREAITKLWLTPDEFSTHYIAIPGYAPGTEPDEPPVDPDNPDNPDIPDVPDETNGIILLFTDDGIPIVDDTNTSDLSHIGVGGLVFDIENIGMMSVDGLTDIDNDLHILVDEQEDVSVNSNKPESTNTAILWIDTDLTDDIW